MSIDLSVEYEHLEPETAGFEQRIAEYIGAAYANNAAETLSEARCVHMTRHMHLAMLQTIGVLPDLSEENVSYELEVERDEYSSWDDSQGNSYPQIADMVAKHDALCEVERDHHEIDQCQCELALDWRMLSERSKRLERGDEWAWCCVRVKAIATIDGVCHSAKSDWLGGCDYASETDYRANSGYFDDQRDEARDRLRAEIAAAHIRKLLA